MAHYSTSKKVPGFTVLGPLMIIIGIALAADTGLRYALSPQMLMEEVSRYFAISNFVLVAIFSFLIMHVGYTLFRGLVFSRYYAVMIMSVCLTAVLLRVFMLGMNPFPWKILISATIPMLVILYLNQRQFRVRFEHKRGLGGIFLFFFWFLSIATAGYCALWVKNNWSDAPGYNKYTYSESSYEEQSEHLPLRFSMKIPDNFHLSSIENDKGEISITFHNPEYGYIIMNNRSSLEPVYKRMRVVGFKNELDFTRKFFGEQIGLIPLFIRKSMTSLQIQEFGEVAMGNLTIFMEKSKGDNAVAHIFSNEELIGEITVLSINNSETGLYNELFRTMKSHEPATDANKLYMDGLKHLEAKKNEYAKRNFASAVALKPGDAEFRYMLAETLALTGYLSSAKRQLDKCLELNENHTRGAKLKEALLNLK